MTAGHAVVCLGCGGLYPEGATCAPCDEKARALYQHHWPLETSISPAAMAHLSAATRLYLREHMVPSVGGAYGELENLANTLDAFLQRQPQAAPVDPLLM